MSSLLIIIASMDVELDWHYVSTLMKRYSVTSTSVYTSLPSINVDEGLVVLFSFLDIFAENFRLTSSKIRSELLESLRGNAEHRFYELLAPGAGMARELTTDHILVMNAMTPGLAAEDSFHNWYTEEHIPLLSCVPSWHSSERYALISSSREHVPQYLALHKWGDMKAFDTEEYKMATTTPWRTKVINEVIDKERLVLKYKGKLDDLTEKDSKLPL